MNKVVVTSLETKGRPHLQPFPLYTPPPIILTIAYVQNLSRIRDSFRSLIALAPKLTNICSVLPLPKNNIASSKMEKRGAGATDCFQAVAAVALPSHILSRGGLNNSKLRNFGKITDFNHRPPSPKNRHRKLHESISDPQMLTCIGSAKQPSLYQQILRQPFPWKPESRSMDTSILCGVEQRER